jgi:hypothetical protein
MRELIIFLNKAGRIDAKYNITRKVETFLRESKISYINRFNIFILNYIRQK